MTEWHDMPEDVPNLPIAPTHMIVELPLSGGAEDHAALWVGKIVWKVAEIERLLKGNIKLADMQRVDWPLNAEKKDGKKRPEELAKAWLKAYLPDGEYPGAKDFRKRLLELIVLRNNLAHFAIGVHGVAADFSVMVITPDYATITYSAQDLKTAFVGLSEIGDTIMQRWGHVFMEGAKKRKEAFEARQRVPSQVASYRQETPA